MASLNLTLSMLQNKLKSYFSFTPQGSGGRKAASENQHLLLLDNCYKTAVETRTDWLALQAIMMISHLRVGEEKQSDIASYAQLVKDIRNEFIQATEALADKAIRKGLLTVGDFADCILPFYKVLPKDLFKNCKPDSSPEDSKGAKKQSKKVLKGKS